MHRHVLRLNEVCEGHAVGDVSIESAGREWRQKLPQMLLGMPGDSEDCNKVAVLSNQVNQNYELPLHLLAPGLERCFGVCCIPFTLCLDERQPKPYTLKPEV